MDKKLTVKQLKDIINDLPDDMQIVTPVIDAERPDVIYGFRFVRTIGVLKDEHENPDTVLCINTTNDFSLGEVKVSDILKENISEGRNKND